ncbi:peptidoglycan recognition protein family protein [Clostridium beijerinckii]|uniref:peptidoglycan recognition protein family protein n=1 Tax=Clostridium beijerinckii TaxID=1520 RepID=UPI0022274EA5|nr:peptidoglycan recognition family protein [Clostridium beijerinckii]UYZ35427.1 peptidoglycan recognition protein family protein [Clostridium beijerinckii]
MNIIDENLSFGSMTWGNFPNMIIVHHIEAEGENWTVEQIHDMHKTENGWAGIGYHYYIRLDGSVYKGRPDNAIGAHCQCCNTNTLEVAFEGNYDNRTVMPDVQYNSWCELKTYLCNKYGNIPVYGHREKGQSECPGKNFPLDKVKSVNISQKGYVVTNYLPCAYEGYDGIDISYVLSYFDGVKCYVRGNAKGIWIETQYLDLDKCNELKSTLGSWFYEIKY